MVLATGQLGKLVHSLLHDARAGIVVLVDGLAALKIHIRILGGTPDHGTIRRQGAPPMGKDEFVGNHRPDHIAGDGFNLLDFMGGPESVEEMQEGNPCLQGSRLGNQGEIMRFLNAGGGQHRKPGLAHRHDIRVIAEDRQSLAGQRAGGDVEHRAGEFAGDLVHIGNHQEQSLRGRERGCQGPGGQSAVNRATGAALGLHLHNLGDGTPDVFHAGGTVLIGPFPHRRGGGNRINRANFVRGVGDIGNRLISVHHDHVLILSHSIQLPF